MPSSSTVPRQSWPPLLEAERVVAHLFVGNVVFSGQPLHAAENAVLDIDELGGPFAEGLEACLAPRRTGVEIQRPPARIARGDFLLDKLIQPLSQRVHAGIAIGDVPQHALHHGPLFFTVVARREDVSNVEPGILIEPVALEAVARQRDVRRVLDGEIGGAGVKAGDFRDLDVQVLPVARRRKSHLAAPGNLRL